MVQKEVVFSVAVFRLDQSERRTGVCGAGGSGKQRSVRIVSRNQRSLVEFAELHDVQGASSAVLDGEKVALDKTRIAVV